MHKSIRPIGPALALLLITLIHPVTILHAAGLQSSDKALAASSSNLSTQEPDTGYTYTVQPDDTLWGIAAAHGITVEALIAANDLSDPQLLRPGQTLFVPAEPPAASPERPAQISSVGYVYAVQPDDTLWDIASAHGITVEALIAANDLVDPRRLQLGQTLFVPAQPPAASPEPPAAAPAAPEASAPAPEAAPTPEPSAEPSAAAVTLPPEIAGWPAALLASINEKRAAQGLPALAWSDELARAAQAHAEDCAGRNRGSHAGSDGARLEARLARVGYEARYASENWANAQSVQHAFALWWNEPRGSEPHRRNILNPKYSEIGIGVAAGPWGYYFIADFASR
jgi:uncharacterized protein YkwD